MTVYGAWQARYSPSFPTFANGAYAPVQDGKMDFRVFVHYDFVVNKKTPSARRFLMRILLKILLFPVILLLSILVAVCRFLCAFSSMILGILAFVIFAVALGTMVLLGEFWEGVKIVVLAWLISPYGIPLFASFLVELVDGLNSRLKAI